MLQLRARVFSRGQYAIPIHHPSSILKVGLLSFVEMVAHMSL